MKLWNDTTIKPDHSVDSETGKIIQGYLDEGYSVSDIQIEFNIPTQKSEKVIAEINKVRAVIYSSARANVSLEETRGVLSSEIIDTDKFLDNSIAFYGNYNSDRTWEDLVGLLTEEF